MLVIFRAEVMPGRERANGKFQVKELLPSGRVLFHRAAGQHGEKEFERIS